MPAMPEIGGEFGGYRVDGLLGRGGMGVVYRAWQHRMGRAVALKVLTPEFAADPGYRDRFAREAEALARLDSPHIVHIYDHGELDGCLFLAMQLVPGPDLGRLVMSGGLPPHRALRITGQVAAALSAAHAVGVLHRDVKPRNVLLRPPGGPGDEDFAYLCDFGIARSLGDPGGTETAGVAGSVEYLAPERFDGLPATPAADVYALGGLLWALLTGDPPFRGSRLEIVLGHARGPVPQLGGSDPRTRALDGLLAAMLAKDPAARPGLPEVRARIRELRAAAAGPAAAAPPGSAAPPPVPRVHHALPPSAGPPPGAPGAGPSRPRRTRLVLAAGLAVAVAAAAGAGAALLVGDGVPRVAFLAVDRDAGAVVVRFTIEGQPPEGTPLPLHADFFYSDQHPESIGTETLARYGRYPGLYYIAEPPAIRQPDVPGAGPQLCALVADARDRVLDPAAVTCVDVPPTPAGG